MNRLKLMPFVALFALLALSCKRDPLCYDHVRGAQVSINVDWSESGLAPSGATLLIYDGGGVLFSKILMADPSSHLVTLPAGNYSFIIFNEAAEDFQRVGFRDMDKYGSAAVYVLPDDTQRSYILSTDDMPATHTPDIIASASLDLFRVTDEMVREVHGSESRAANPSLTLTPKRITNTTVLIVHIKGLCNASAVVNPLAILSGMAQSVSLHDRTTCREGVRHYFEFSEREFYPGSDRDGTIRATATVLGLLSYTSDAPTIDPRFRYRLDMVCRLADNVTNYYPPVCPYDITDKITLSTENHTIHINAELGMGSEGDMPVELPETEGSGDDIGGFDPEIKDWDDVTVTLPI